MTPFSFFEIVLRFLALLCLVNTLIVIVFRLEIPKSLFNILGKLVLVAGTVTTFSYLQEILVTWIIGDDFDRFVILNLVIGKDYFWLFWLYILCIGILLQLLWLQRVRQSVWRLFIISIIVLASLWFLRFMPVAISMVNGN